MAEPAIRRMTLDEFLHWEDGTDTRYELIDGVPSATAPPARAHGILFVTLDAMIMQGFGPNALVECKPRRGFPVPGATIRVTSQTWRSRAGHMRGANSWSKTRY